MPTANGTTAIHDPHAYSWFRFLDWTKSVGGASRDRTGDLLLAKQALSQLSYGPSRRLAPRTPTTLVGLGRFELPTSPLSGVRSNQLSYRPDVGCVSPAPGQARADLETECSSLKTK
jgi:hypothetical protein